MHMALTYSGVKQHPAFHCNHNGIHEIIGGQLLFDHLKMLPNRALTNVFRFRNLFSNLSHGSTLKNGGFALCKQRPRVRTLARLNEKWNNAFELLEVRLPLRADAMAAAKYTK